MFWSRHLLFFSKIAGCGVTALLYLCGQAADTPRAQMRADVRHRAERAARVIYDGDVGEAGGGRWTQSIGPRAGGGGPGRGTRGVPARCTLVHAPLL